MALHRRTVLRASAGTAILLGTGRFSQMLAAQEAPAVIKRDGARPQMEQGVASGDVMHDRAMIWSRCDRPAQMVVEWVAASQPFGESDFHRVVGPAAIEATDFTAKLDLRG